MEQIADPQLKNFFQAHREEIPDNGFSREVLSRLPAPSSGGNYRWVVWLCSAVGLLSVFLTGTVVSLLKLIVISSVKLSASIDTLLEWMGREGSISLFQYLGVVVLMGTLTFLLLPKIREELD